MPDLSALLSAKPFKGKLFPQQASEAMDAAKRTANELLKTAEVLFEAERFAHCVSMSILAMEEAGKRPIIMGLFLGLNDFGSGWKDYGRHHAKTQFINKAIEMQVRTHFPKTPKKFAELIGNLGPDSETLEKTKQLAVYSGCLEKKGKCEVHEPSSIEWKPIANYVLDDARVFIGALRYYSPAELSIWLKHAQHCLSKGLGFETELAALENDLQKAGFIQAGWWDSILEMNRGES